MFYTSTGEKNFGGTRGCSHRGVGRIYNRDRDFFLRLKIRGLSKNQRYVYATTGRVSQ